MASQDEWRDEEREIAGLMTETVNRLRDLISAAEEGEDVSFLTNTADKLDAWAKVFSPPGEPENGYPKEGATVISLDSWRGRNG